jgi:hypothetical protein
MPQSAFDLNNLELLRSRSPAWRLLGVTHAPFIISFLHTVYVADQQRLVPEQDILRRLEDHLAAARQEPTAHSYQRKAKEYLDHWVSDECGWLRASYPPGSDEPVYDITAAARRAIEWVGALEDRSFVGTASRLLTVIDLLKQIRSGSETDPVARLRDLEAKRAEVEAEIRRVAEGRVHPVNDAVIRDQFQVAADNAQLLLADLVEVEQNFRKLDRETRTKVAEWDGSKGALLDEIFQNRNVIAESVQGRSFRAFYEFLMSNRRKEELDGVLRDVLSLPALAIEGKRLSPDIRHEWWRAADQAQRTIARLSEQLRCFLVERSALENRRIIQIMRNIERHAAELRSRTPPGDIMAIDEATPSINLVMDRPLFTPQAPTRFEVTPIELGVADADTAPLFDQIYIDTLVLARHVRETLVHSQSVSLATVVEDHPLRFGVAELLGYLRLASDDQSPVKGYIIDDKHDTITWTNADGITKQARVPRVIFER